MKKTYILRNELDAQRLAGAIKSAKIDKPLLVTAEPYRKRRSVEQNRLQRLWMNEAADQLKEETAEGYRAFCKLHFGVPILHLANEKFREAYDEVVAPLPYESKLRLMALPLDFPVTRMMTTSQISEYLEAVRDHFLSLGVSLTDPNVDI